MKRNFAWVAAIVAVVLGLTSGVLLAQKAGQHAQVRVLRSEIGGESFMGVVLNDVTPQRARELKLAGESGALVADVDAEGPAAKAGIQKDDVITEFDGERVRSAAELRRLVRETPPGRSVKVRVNRQSETRDLNITLAPRHVLLGERGIHIPEIHIPPVNVPFNFNFSWGAGRLGISAQELTPQLADYFGVTQRKGVLVAEVRKGSPAEVAGLKAGDCVVKIDSKPVTSVWDLRSALNEDAWGDSGKKRQHVLTIVRDHREQKITIEVEAASWPGSGESAGVLAPEPPEPPEPPPSAEPIAPELNSLPELNGLEDSIAQLKAQAIQAKAEAQSIKREVQRELRSAEFQKQLTEMRQQVQRELDSAAFQKQLAEMQQQVQAISKDQVMRQFEQMKRQLLDSSTQKELRRQYEQLRREMVRYRDTV